MAFALGPKAAEAGYRVAAFETIDSTNREALDRAAAGDVGDLWVVSPRQEAGRGRRGRPWATAEGNLAASILTIIEGEAIAGATLGFVAGLSLDEALRRVAPSLDVAIAVDAVERGGAARRDRLRLKWPNDVLLDGAKLAGILLETRPLGAGRHAVVAGIGVNVVSAPTDVPYPATSLVDLGVVATAESLFAALAEAWVGVARVWDGGRSFPRIRDLWLARAAGIGEPAVVRIAGEVVAGVLETIDDQGRLVIRGQDGGQRTITAGDVHFGTAATVRA